MIQFTELSSLLSLIAVVVSISVGIGTLRQRVNEPNEKRWREFETWKDEVDEKLDRDYHSINRVSAKIGRHQEFERLMLRSMLGINEHLISGNHKENLQEVSEQINDYLIGGREKRDLYE